MRNPNTALPNKNTLYLARSGGGKSQALLQNKAIPAKGARVVLWDTNNDHKASHYSSMSAYLKALAAANNQYYKTGRGFRIAYDGNDTIENYNLWCQALMLILDGNHLTFAIVEELSALCTSAGKAPPIPAKMMNQGRKYGMIFHGTTQKPQEISKTYFDQCEITFCGRQKTMRQKKIIAEELGVTVDQITRLNELEFLYDDGKNPIKTIQFKYKKPS